jgi:cystathionine gamma-synthase
LAAIARQHHAFLAVDNTFATPVLQNRCARRARRDALHTKYIGGHSDVLGGALVFAEADTLWEAGAAPAGHLLGAVPSPFNAWLTCAACARCRARGMALPQRAPGRGVPRRARESRGGALPRTGQHPGHAIAAKQMRGFRRHGVVRGEGRSRGGARDRGKLQLFTNATSLGGCESLVEHRASVEGPRDGARRAIAPSVGLEHPTI